MTAVAGRVWGWVRPAFSYRPWGTKPAPKEKEPKSGWGLGGVTAWVWGGRRKDSDSDETMVQYWETDEVFQGTEIKELRSAAKVDSDETAQAAPRWWSRVLPSPYWFWPRVPADTQGFERQQHVGWDQGGWDSDKDGAESDYGTPPPSPTPSSHPASPFRLFARSWKGEVLPEHYEICFNFLRHLFDLFVVGFLWTVSPPVRTLLEMSGCQGALKLWLHGMAMFLVSTVGMAGLLWLIQEYLPQFALVYGIIQALVISVSVRQDVGASEEGREGEQEGEEGGEEQPQEEEESGGEGCQRKPRLKTPRVQRHYELGLRPQHWKTPAQLCVANTFLTTTAERAGGPKITAPGAGRFSVYSSIFTWIFLIFNGIFLPPLLPPQLLCFKV
ncbi:hypothetical protein JZ751_011443 [Albula glossodonta]|uniref:Uncharacterized protein n=1 Tax=Albula glossodonta TaxID=121402 RepID=A0A8T2N0W1_9TELE|nr:hypothetical protein JZ751_011443 [Albula glossodonta]